MASPKPFVQIAAFCEMVLEQKEPEGTVMTPVRIVDTYTVQIPPDMPKDVLPAIAIHGLIALKSGEVRGPHNIKLVMENPLGERKPVGPPDGWEAVFEGGASGFNLRLEFPLGVKNYGLCWFDVFFDGELITRMPLRLREHKPDQPSATDSPN